MPNWCDNIIITKDPALIDRYITEGRFDFDKVTHMPEELSVDAICGYRPIACFLSERYTKPVDENKIEAICKACEGRSMSEWEKIDLMRAVEPTQLDKYYELGKIYLSNFEKYGALCWYDWSTKNWGTKWNACDTRLQADGVVTFLTPWCMPKQVFSSICMQNAEEKIIFVTLSDDGEAAIFSNDHGNLNTELYREHTRMLLSTLRKKADRLAKIEFAESCRREECIQIARLI